MKNIEIKTISVLNSNELVFINGGSETTETIMRCIGWWAAAIRDGAAWNMRHIENDPTLGGI